DNSPSARTVTQPSQDTTQTAFLAPPRPNPLTYAGSSRTPVRQTALVDTDMSTTGTAANSSSSKSPAGDPSQADATGMSGTVAAKAPKGAGKDPQKQPRINQDAVPLTFAPVSTQVAQQPSQPLGVGLPVDTSGDSESSSHPSGGSGQLATGQATPLVASLPGEENAGAKTAPNGKSSSSQSEASVPEDLTFAARIQPAASASKASPDSTRRPVGDSMPAARHGVGASGKDQTPDTPAPVASQQSAAAVAQRFDVEAPRTDSNSPIALPAAQPAAETQPTQNAEAAVPKAPLKDISFQVGQAQGQKVEVRVTQQAGELRVAVRTGDTDVAQGLRQGLSELTTKLSENGYRAEAWRPGELTALTLNSSKEASDTPGHSSNGGSQSQSQSGSPQQDRGQQNQNPSNRPRWVQELETTLRSGAGSTGDFNGLIS
ncbi:MAG: hypothetical protein ABSG41_20980, partial [Bryobacteraceae bacterium]